MKTIRFFLEGGIPVIRAVTGGTGQYSNIRPYTLVILEDVRSGAWGVGGQGLTTDDVRS